MHAGWALGVWGAVLGSLFLLGFLGSGQGPVVLAEAGLDGESQYRAINSYVGRSVRA